MNSPTGYHINFQHPQLPLCPITDWHIYDQHIRPVLGDTTVINANRVPRTWQIAVIPA